MSQRFSVSALVGSLCLVGMATVSCHSPRETTYDPGRFEKEVLVAACEDPTEIDVLADGRVLWVERAGAVKLYRPKDRRALLLGTVPVVVRGERGLLGIAADPQFERTGWIYLFFCLADAQATMRLARFTVNDQGLDLASERKVLEYPIDFDDTGHIGGGLAFDGSGNLLIGTGDNSPPIPELPVDQRPGREHNDSLRSSANTADLRGKILRIHPEPDGNYTIPRGNLFRNAPDGRPEIYVMGCRNAFRIAADKQTDVVYWGDVGPNITVELGIGPGGYDEINRAGAAGNFGWPMFVGPNEPYHNFDFTTMKPGPLFDVAEPVNASRNNTGARRLPPPLPALIWYPNTESREFPALGSGGRSAMAGPVFHYDGSSSAASVGLPEALDGVLFIYDWMRNAIQTVRLDRSGKVVKVEPFLADWRLRKPMDLKLGPEGALYLAETGDMWTGNRDSQISRIVYRRGNRPPQAVAAAIPRAGKQPLRVRLDAGGSHDKDAGDRLTYTWTIPSRPAFRSQAPTTEVEFDRPGKYPIELRVTDSQGAVGSTRVEVEVGNSRPVVGISEPANGGFFDWDRPIGYKVAVEDLEDGSTASGSIASDLVRVEGQYLSRRPGPDGLDPEANDPGLALMRRTTCFGCHTTDAASRGPAYAAVAKKYRGDPRAADALAQKVLSGGAGVWGSEAMPPHPQHTREQARLMVEWVLRLDASSGPIALNGAEGGWIMPPRPAMLPEGGVYVITARYRDKGAAGAAPLDGEATVILHARRRRAAFADIFRSVEIMDDLDGAGGAAVQMHPDGIVAFRAVDLKGIARATLMAAAADQAESTFELHADAPDGPFVSHFELSHSGAYQELTRPLLDPGGLHDLFIVARRPAGRASGKFAARLSSIEFQLSESAAEAQNEAQALVRKQLEKRVNPSPALTPARPFVKNWRLEDLTPHLAEAGRGRSFQRGQALFHAVSCAGCHRVGREGNTLGPDLTDVARRMEKQANPRLALVQEIVEPSRVVAPQFRTVLVATADGRQLAGIVVARDAKSLTIAADPVHPEVRSTIPADQIDDVRPSDVSLMPAGLLSTLSRDEILDLIAYLESGGDRRRPAFSP